MKRSVLLVLNALLLSGSSQLVFAQGGSHLVTDGTTTIRVPDDDWRQHRAMAHGYSTLRPTPRAGDPRLKAAREAAEARKIKSEQK